MKIGSYELKKEQLVIAISAAAVLCAFVLALIFYIPVMKKLGKNNTDCCLIEKEVREARALIAQAGKIYGDRILINEDEVGVAMDELAKHGKLMGVNFISMKPGEIREVPGAKYKEISIEMQVESNDKQLSDFIGSLDELKKGVIKLDSFEIAPKAVDSTVLESKLVIDMYISGHKYAK
ncbi:MAG: type 4a pilus biogenesis protein PilO [Candidatus Omnitrophota bacterium]